MMQRLAFILIGFLAASTSSRGAQENLIKNSGFEEPGATNGSPAGGWWLYTAKGEPQLKWDNAVARSGKGSARVHAPMDAKCTVVSSPFNVAPGDEIRFEAWVRAEKLPPGGKASYVGVAFRQKDGRVFERAYVEPGAFGTNWNLVAGTARVPLTATTAEIHLGYTNAPATLWWDDVAAFITSPVSLSLVEGAEPWAGDQELTLLVANRQTNEFRGMLKATVARGTRTMPVLLEPKSSRHLKMPITLTGVGAHNYAISLLDAAGVVLRSLEGKFQTRPPLVLYPVNPCFHVIGEGDGNTRLDARINLSPARRVGLKLTVRVLDDAGKELQRQTTPAESGETVGMNLRLPIQGPGTFSLACALIDEAGKELATGRTEARVGSREESRVITGADGFLRVNGKANFPIGMYSCGHFEEMGTAGFSVTHNYGITTGEAQDAINPNEARLKELLDTARANGMRMMVELPRKAIEKAQWAQIRRRIETFRHHPGLLCWGSEERVARGEAPLANLAALYRLVHELDPDHPLVLGDTKDVIQKFQKDRSDFFPDDCMDAGIWWWYPIPLKEPDGNGLDGKGKGLLEPPSWLTTTRSQKPLWIAIQSYQHPTKDARFPTPAEYRCLAYLSIIKGVKGLFFYTGSGQKDYLGKPAGLLNKPEEGHWDYVQSLVRELRELEPVILAAKGGEQLAMTPAAAPVEFTTRSLEGKLYLLAANKSSQAQSVRFTSSSLAGRRARLRFESGPAALAGEALAVSFPPFGVHVYEFD